ncbi:MAG: Calx-beta domain-containing protein, partial [Limisphaerales bacterium]
MKIDSFSAFVASLLLVSPVLRADLTNHPPIVSIKTTVATAVEGGQNGQFTVTRFYDPLTNDLTVPYAISGTASNGIDFVTLSGSVVIPAGSSNATITVQAIDDTIPEPTEYVTLTLASNTVFGVTS